MTSDEYVRWAEARAGIPPHPVTPPHADGTSVEALWEKSAFRCNPHACEKVCCTGWIGRRGIRLKVADLIRFRAAGLLDSVEGVFALDPPDYPRLRAVDGHCVHYDVGQRRCTVWEHRPLICRTFPYALAWVTKGGSVGLTVEQGCSLTPAVPPTESSGHAVKPRRYLAVRSAQPTRPARELSPYERSHLAACIESLNEHERTNRLVTERPELLAELGLEAFGPVETGQQGEQRGKA